MTKCSSLLILIWSVLVIGCDTRPAVPPATAASGKSPRVASLVPAATDLLVGMGAVDYLVAVSNWDAKRPEIERLPRVGDYQTIDWEKLAELKPDVMIVFSAVDRLPPGVQQRAEQIHMRLVNVQTERLADIFAAIDKLGELIGEPTKAGELNRRMHSQLDAVARRVAGQEPIATLIARDEDGFALIAGDTFVDDLLTIAGGKNVAGDIKTRYPNVDRERVIELSPAAIVQLMPDASPQVLERAKQMWQKVPQLPAVKDGKVYILTDWYVLQPGSHVGDLAEKLADALHPLHTSPR